MSARTRIVRRPCAALRVMVASPKVPDLYQEVDGPCPVTMALTLAKGPLVRPHEVSLEVEALLEEEVRRRPIGLNTVPAIRLSGRRLAVAWAVNTAIEAVDVAGPEESVLQVSITLWPSAA